VNDQKLGEFSVRFYAIHYSSKNKSTEGHNKDFEELKKKVSKTLSKQDPYDKSDSKKNPL
jgi:hypothetical protein